LLVDICHQMDGFLQIFAVNELNCLGHNRINEDDSRKSFKESLSEVFSADLHIEFSFRDCTHSDLILRPLRVLFNPLLLLIL
jgi:hypothetical protein